MKSKYNFDEMVIIKPDIAAREDKLKEYKNIKGTIIAKGRNNDGTWGYNVFLEITNTVWDFHENELEPTGKFVPPETEPRETIRVVVNEKGEGEIKEDE